MFRMWAPASVSRQRLSGGELQKAIMDLAHTHGFLVAHFRSVQAGVRGGGTRWMTPVAADGKGWPDLALVRDRPPRRFLVAEVKGDGDRLRPEQKQWLLALMDAGVETHVWTPKDWHDGTIEGVLA